jgi:hypothetical protein
VSNRYVPAAIKRLVFERANGCCEYCHCQQELSPDTFSIEHILPKALSGADSVDNYAFSCQGCNGHKLTAIEAADPETGALVPLYNPRTQAFSDHFEWTPDYQRLLGKTPTGRATIARLQLNRPYVVNLRRALTISGDHPPAHMKL